MSAQFTTQQYINFGEATVYLMQNYEASGALFGKKLINRASPVMVAIVTDILKWQYEINVAAAGGNITIDDFMLINSTDYLLINSVSDKLII